LERPSTKEEIKYRPFLVKEEKILLLAMEEDNEKMILNAVRQIVNNCTFEALEVNNLPMFDLEYVFLNIRAKSVGEVASIRMLCDDDKETYVNVDIPLDKVKVKFQENHTNVIKLNDEIIIEMLYPTFEMVSKAGTINASTEAIFDLINECVLKIIDGETVYERTDFTKKELGTFIDSLDSKQFQAVQDFFETMPKLQHEVEYENPNTGKTITRTLEGLQSFFA
jgi:hypothetical protein